MGGAQQGRKSPRRGSVCGVAIAAVTSNVANQPATAAVAPATSMSEQAVQAEQPAAADAAEVPAKPKQIGGWLLFFCFGTILVAPVNVLAEAMASKHLWVQIYDSALACASFSAGISVAIVSRRAKVFVRIYFLLGLIIVGLILVRFLNAGRADDAGVMHIFRGTAYVVIWSLYFRSSNRVRETFGENW